MFYINSFIYEIFMLRIFCAFDSVVVGNRVVAIWMELLLMAFLVWDLETFQFQASLQEMD